MLNRISIEDFQSHKQTILDLHEGVNVIIGKTDSGKSAILRALLWAISNKCDDSSFMRTGAKSSHVSLEFDEGVVTRSRVGKDNLYQLVQSKKENKYTAFKQEIPAEVAGFLNMNDVNVQSQLEAPFLLSQTSGEVAKTLNRMVDLSIIHESLSGIKKRVLFNSRDIEDTKKQLADNEELLEEFKFIPALEKKVKAYEALCRERIEVETNIQRLSKAMSRYQHSLDKIDSFDELLSSSEKVDETLKSIQVLAKLDYDIGTIKSIIKRTYADRTVIKKANQLVPLKPKVEELIDSYRKELKIVNLIVDTEEYQAKVFSRGNALDLMETEYIEAMPEDCPLCGHTMLEVE